jgi:hypothetical protein
MFTTYFLYLSAITVSLYSVSDAQICETSELATWQKASEDISTILSGPTETCSTEYNKALNEAETGADEVAIKCDVESCQVDTEVLDLFENLPNCMTAPDQTSPDLMLLTHEDLIKNADICNKELIDKVKEIIRQKNESIDKNVSFPSEDDEDSELKLPANKAAEGSVPCTEEEILAIAKDLKDIGEKYDVQTNACKLAVHGEAGDIEFTADNFCNVHEEKCLVMDKVSIEMMEAHPACTADDGYWIFETFYEQIKDSDVFDVCDRGLKTELENIMKLKRGDEVETESEDSTEASTDGSTAANAVITFIPIVIVTVMQVILL